MKDSKTDYFAKRKVLPVGTWLLLLLLSPFLAQGNSSNIFESLIVLDTCPIIGSLDDLDFVCKNESFDLRASGLSLFDSLENGAANFGIQFVYFSTNPIDPYIGGTVLGQVPFESLLNGSEANLNDLVFENPGDFEIYALLFPPPSDTLCRPFAVDTLTVNTLPSALNHVTDPMCPGDTSGVIELTVGGTGPFNFNWSTLDGSGLENGVEDQSNLSAGLYHLTLTDGSLAACQRSYDIYLNEEDTTPPVLNCSGDIIQSLGSGACNVVISFAITATDDCTFFTGRTHYNTNR